MSDAQNSNSGKRLAKAGALLQCALVLGMACGVAAMAIDDNTNYSAQEAATACPILMAASGFGIVIGLVGVAQICASLYSYRYRAPWFFWFLVVYGGVILFAFGLGTIIGAFFLIFSLTHRKEFLGSNKAIAHS